MIKSRDSSDPKIPHDTTLMAAPNEGREMTIHQRGLVDTCFEEGQYEPGIAVLDQLRSSSFKPPADHIRQLIYIALFPPSPPTGDQINQHVQIPSSPLKGSPTKQKPVLSKASLSPSVSDAVAAQRVLFSFLATNSPGSLLRALPRYPLDADNELPPGSNDNSYNEDSPIARESLCIKDSRNCWAIFKDGFIQRKKLLSQDARKKRRRTAYDVEDSVLYQDQGTGTPAVVAEHAWPILQWLLSLFEKDELLHSQKSGEKFSPLLLSQIPPPRGTTGPRWEAGAPLDIVFHAVSQDDGERRDVAIRLLALLINLTLSAHFDGPMFAATLTTRLYTSSSQIAQNLMESLPKTILALTFKITVCQRFLSSSPSTSGGTKPRPKPLPKRGARRDSGTISSATNADIGRTVPSRPALPMYSEVFQLLCSKHESQTDPPVLAIKYSLLISYAQLQGLLPRKDRDPNWTEALSNGKLKHLIDTAFPGDRTYRTALTILLVAF